MSEITRREAVTECSKFIVLTATAAAALGAMANKPDNADPTPPESNYKMKDHWWAFTIDVSKCIGAGNCVRACAEENSVPEGFFRTWVERYHVEDYGTSGKVGQPQVDSPDGGKHGFPDKYGSSGKTFFVPKLCNHCENSPCVQVCPVGATFETPDGLVLVDKTYCLGCAYCVQACPYGCRYISPDTHTVDKCTLCYHRISKGLTTACAEACPTGARKLADLKDPKDPVHAFLRDNAVQVLKPQMATGSKNFYKDLDGSVR